MVYNDADNASNTATNRAAVTDALSAAPLIGAGPDENTVPPADEDDEDEEDDATTAAPVEEEDDEDEPATAVPLRHTTDAYRLTVAGAPPAAGNISMMPGTHEAPGAPRNS